MVRRSPPASPTLVARLTPLPTRFRYLATLDLDTMEGPSHSTTTAVGTCPDNACLYRAGSPIYDQLQFTALDDVACVGGVGAGFPATRRAAQGLRVSNFHSAIVYSPSGQLPRGMQIGGTHTGECAETITSVSGATKTLGNADFCWCGPSPFHSSRTPP